MTIITAMVSPIALPIARIMESTRFPRAAGSTTWAMPYQEETPMASEAGKYRSLAFRRVSLQEEIR